METAIVAWTLWVSDYGIQWSQSRMFPLIVAGTLSCTLIQDHWLW